MDAVEALAAGRPEALLLGWEGWEGWEMEEEAEGRDCGRAANGRGRGKGLADSRGVVALSLLASLADPERSQLGFRWALVQDE